MAINRRVVVATSDGGDEQYGPDELSQKFPFLVEFLTELKFSDGTPRLPGSLSFFSEDGCLKACLNDKSEGLVTFVTGPGLGGLLELLEAGLQGDNLYWQKSKDRPGKRRR